MANPGPFKRPLYPPSASKGPVKDGNDVIAVKRAISRAGFFDWQTFDDSYNEKIADAVQHFQRTMGIEDTGFYGEKTHDELRATKVPSGSPNAGQTAFDDKAAELYRGYSVPGKADTIRKYMTEFCERGLNDPDWVYRQDRAVDISVDPTGRVRSDCSGSVIQIYWYASQKADLPVPDPAKQNWSGYGNTSYFEDDHPTVTDGQYRVGDLAHYEGHVCLCFHAGNRDTADWWSFGSEPPSKRKLNYRSDFRKVVRPPLQ